MENKAVDKRKYQQQINYLKKENERLNRTIDTLKTIIETYEKEDKKNAIDREWEEWKEMWESEI